MFFETTSGVAQLAPPIPEAATKKAAAALIAIFFFRSTGGFSDPIVLFLADSNTTKN
jgi:hypothetical protein